MNTDNEETKRQWVKRLTSGQRSPADGLTDGERLVLETVRRLGYEIAPEGNYRRYIKRIAA